MQVKPELLRGHPIFGSRNQQTIPLEFSLNNLSSSQSSRDSVNLHPRASPLPAVGRRNIMVLRESDVILAAGSEIRIASLMDANNVSLQQRSYKVFHTPNLEFEIRQITTNPNGRLLAVAGTHQVAVVSLPRTGYSKLTRSEMDCSTVHVGQLHHALTSSAPICKIEWHPWGKSACTLLVMTIDGILREYDISLDPEEPQQTLSFMPERSWTSSSKGDSSTREVTSFCLGKGKADWGPLTVYALTKNGDIWAMCPFIPSNSTIPSAYIHALEYFVRAKEELASNPNPQATSPHIRSRPEFSFSTLYAYQLKYAMSLSKQLPVTPSTLFPAPSRPITIKAPSIIKSRPARQGPFLFQPAPRELEQGQGGDATDLTYLSIEGAASLQPEIDDGGRLGVLAVAYSDGKVDICLDVEKIEAMWENNPVQATKPVVSELPMVAVYETIDLGLVSMLSGIAASEPPSWLENRTGKGPVDILQANHPVFVSDPIYKDTLYLYHAFGVHCLNMGRWLRPLASSMRGNVDEQLEIFVKKSPGSQVTSMIDTFSPQLRFSQPVVSVVLPSDPCLSYSLLAITSSFDIQTFELPLRVDSLMESTTNAPCPPLQQFESLLSAPLSNVYSIPGVEARDHSLITLLSKEPYLPPPAISPAAVSSVRKLVLQSPAFARRELGITPETLRQFATVVRNLQCFIRDIYIALHEMQDRLMLQDKEFQRQQGKYVDTFMRTERLRGSEKERIKQRFDRTTAAQKHLLRKSDHLLQKLMDVSSPMLNEHEKRWFAELRRLWADVLGDGDYDTTCLKARLENLTRKLEFYLPNLQGLAKEEERRRQAASQCPILLGREQELKIMMKLGEHKRMLAESVQKIEQLAASMDIAFENHPELE